MKLISKLAAASALALSMAAAASPANALIQFAASSVETAPGISWTAGPGNVGGTISSTTNINWFFNETLVPVTGLGSLDAVFSLNGVSTSAYGCDGSTCGVAGINGSFSYIYSGPTKNYVWYGLNRTLNTGDNLLSASFQNAWVQGTGSAGSFNASTVSSTTPAVITSISSDIFNFANANGQFDLSFSLAGISGPGGLTVVGNTYRGFTANSSGAFAAGSIPEPGTWALMILGFGGAGAMIRSRRKVLAAA